MGEVLQFRAANNNNHKVKIIGCPSCDGKDIEYIDELTGVYIIVDEAEPNRVLSVICRNCGAELTDEVYDHE